MERTERQRRNHPLNRSLAPSESAGSSSSSSRRTFSNRSRNSDYKHSKYNTNSNRSFEGDSDWRSRRSSDNKIYVQKLETKEDDGGHADRSHFDLPPVIVGTCPFMCPGKLKPPTSSNVLIFVSGLSTLFSIKVVREYVFRCPPRGETIGLYNRSQILFCFLYTLICFDCWLYVWPNPKAINEEWPNLKNRCKIIWLSSDIYPSWNSRRLNAIFINH